MRAHTHLPHDLLLAGQDEAEVVLEGWLCDLVHRAPQLVQKLGLCTRHLSQQVRGAASRHLSRAFPRGLTTFQTEHSTQIATHRQEHKELERVRGKVHESGHRLCDQVNSKASRLSSF